MKKFINLKETPEEKQEEKQAEKPEEKQEEKPEEKQEEKIPLPDDFEEIFLNSLPDEPKKRGRKKKDTLEIEAKDKELKDNIEIKIYIDMLFSLADEFINQYSLPSINPIQKKLIELGLVGCIKKYSLMQYISETAYPEISLSLGLIYYGYDIYNIKFIKKEDLKNE